MAAKIKRLFWGLFLVIIVSISYFLSLDLPIFIFCILAVLYDIFYSKLITLADIKKFFFILIVIPILFFFISYSILFLFIILLLLFSIYKNLFLKETFIISLLFFFYSIVLVYSIDRNYIYIIILLSFLNDTAAYVFGNLFKGPLILPQISPKKTWSGTFFSSLISFFLIFFIFSFNFYYSLILSLSFFLGDIYFSYFKRYFLLKDYSNLIPGHGGVLDRLDSTFLFTILLFIILNL